MMWPPAHETGSACIGMPLNACNPHLPVEPTAPVFGQPFHNVGAEVAQAEMQLAACNFDMPATAPYGFCTSPIYAGCGVEATFASSSPVIGCSTMPQTAFAESYVQRDDFSGSSPSGGYVAAAQVGVQVVVTPITYAAASPPLSTSIDSAGPWTGSTSSYTPQKIEPLSPGCYLHPSSRSADASLCPNLLPCMHAGAPAPLPMVQNEGGYFSDANLSMLLDGRLQNVTYGLHEPQNEVLYPNTWPTDTSEVANVPSSITPSNVCDVAPSNVESATIPEAPAATPRTHNSAEDILALRRRWAQVIAANASSEPRK
eukprot:gnl/TRDRNA2_/TRDRNA2_186039_c0_seq1.p1 gnl/TRDRNA2_/TRDRNA2_186039_c0~~gnl/TRDRNA2_/TRDRNA2_186039_c0_seq1.p1  ORF type:complete len:314 (-),score=40.68 gnl/TRDRNA2_/TRDRNA2_186039_c0_seq1:255-1196(-)